MERQWNKAYGVDVIMGGIKTERPLAIQPTDAKAIEYVERSLVAEGFRNVRAYMVGKLMIGAVAE
jgi:hypothetical protein